MYININEELTQEEIIMAEELGLQSLFDSSYEDDYLEE